MFAYLILKHIHIIYTSSDQDEASLGGGVSCDFLSSFLTSEELPGVARSVQVLGGADNECINNSKLLIALI